MLAALGAHFFGLELSCRYWYAAPLLCQLERDVRRFIAGLTMRARLHEPGMTEFELLLEH